jgi:MFS family permease
MVALVQTALMLPLMIVALPAGAIADMFDRRKIALTGLGFAIVASTALTVLAFLGLTTPWVLLGCIVLVGTGVALYSPSWQASIGEQVSPQNLPQAIALGTISYNVARSFGPAIGGLVVLAFGAKAAFGINTVFYIPLWLAFFAWTRRHSPSRLPPERIDRAIVSGARYALHSPSVRIVLIRALVFGLTTATASALAPLVAKDMPGGNAGIYGVLLGATGVGAVLGALFVGELRHRLSTEAAVRLFAIGGGLSLLAIGFSQSLVLTCLAFFVMGACNILTVSLLNVAIQLSAPRWVTARALSLYSSALTAGIGIGAWAWGEVAASWGVGFAFIASGLAVMATALLGFVLRLPDAAEVDTSTVDIGHEPEVALGLSLRSGPIVVEVEYDVDPGQAREFYSVMVHLQRARSRIGAFDWSLSRDIADPAIWVERYHCPTWGDYLRMRDRYTQAEFELQEMADSFNRSGHGHRVRRRLERPFGSVRWKADSPDPYRGTVGYIGP